MPRSFFFPCIIALISVLAACSPDKVPPTEVVISIDADDAVREATADVNVFIHTAASAKAGTWDTRLADSARDGLTVKWPIVFVLEPRDQDAERVLDVMVSAIGANRVPIVKKRLTTGFVAERTVVHAIFLDSACTGDGRACVKNQCRSVDCETCDDGECRSAWVSPADALSYTPSLDLADLPGFSPRRPAEMSDASVADPQCPGGCGVGQICDTEAETPRCECDAGFQDNDDDGNCERTCGSAGLDCNMLSQACDDTTGTPTCICLDGFQDNDGNGDCLRTCASAALGCDGSTERCDDSSGEAQCICAPTYQDNDGDGSCHLDCDNRLPRCANATEDCVYDDDGVAQCQCAAGYQDHDGDGECEPDCALAALGCDEPSQLCDDTTGTAMCICAMDYQDIDDNSVCMPACSAFGPANCDAVSELCEDTTGTAQCICAPNYQDNDGDLVCTESCSTFEAANCDAGTESCDEAGGTAACVCASDYQDNDGDQACTEACSTFEGAHCDALTEVCDDTGGTAGCECRSAYLSPDCRWCADGYQDRDLDASCEAGCEIAALGCTQGQRCDDSSGSPACIVLPDCTAIRQRDPGATDGVYMIDPDGVGGRAPIAAECDMTTAGGGWTLVLNYVHQGGTDPALAPSDQSLPVLGVGVLGDDGSLAGNEASWGHASSALLSELAPTELRFEGRSSGSGGDVHFSTDHSGCSHHARLGSEGTGCKGIEQSFTPLQGHTASLPASADSFGVGDNPLTEMPFAAADAQWAIGAGGGRWEVDELQAGGSESDLDTIHRVWVRRVPRDCADVKLQQPDAPSGPYLIDPDGPGGLAAFSAACDMTTDGGGWTLVLNYLHEGGTQPATLARSADLPLRGADVPGADEVGTATWGHADNAMLARLAADEVRFFASGSREGRTIHFRSGHAGCIDYLSTGQGDCSGIEQDFVELAGHDGLLPASADSFTGDQGDAALRLGPFFEAGNANWTVGGSGPLWEADDVDVGGGDGDTLHRVWVRRLARSCSALKLAYPHLADGAYRIDPDGPGGLDPLDAYCDMTTAGGGWTLVLNYVHLGGEDPAPLVRTDSLPILSAAALGQLDRPEAFGHASNALLAALGASELRFYAESSAHGRRHHFRTPRCVPYFTTGSGSCSGIQDDFGLLPRHSSFSLPDQASSFEANQGELAMTNRPFSISGLNAWSVGFGGDWDVDDSASGAANDTVHRIWARQARSCREVQQLDPNEPTGFHTIDPDGVGPLPSRRVFCDMDFDGGGWTLTMATHGGRPSILFEVEVDPASPGRTPPAELQVLAEGAQQIHIRTPQMSASASITSTPGSAPIANIAAGLRANASPVVCAADDPVPYWGGPYAQASRLYSDCTAIPQPDELYPGVFWAHGNAAGMTLADVASSWDVSQTSSEPMEVYLR